MQNIDVVFLLQPLVVISLASGLVIYWHYRRSFRGVILAYSLVAYSVAIALKYAVQIPTVSSVTNYFGTHSVGIGVYYGIQTVVFEVGLAYLICWYGVTIRKLGPKDAEAFGLGLGFWENAVLLGLTSLINLLAYYAILSTNTPTAQTLFNQLNKSSPALFEPPSQAFKAVVAGVVERISSILIHFSWGYLCMIAAFFRKRRYFAIALPMGFVDFLVPFASSLGTALFEAIVFVLSILCLAVALLSTKGIQKKQEVPA